MKEANMSEQSPETTSSSRNVSPFDKLASLEYEHLTTSFLQNESDGEKRLTLFLTLTGLAGAGAAFAWKELLVDRNSAAGQLPLLFLCVALGLLGYATLLRLINRNLETTKYLRGLWKLRRYFDKEGDLSRQYLLFDPYSMLPPTREKEDAGFGKGGYVETVALVESLIAAAFTWLLLRLVIPVGWPLWPSPRPELLWWGHPASAPAGYVPAGAVLGCPALHEWGPPAGAVLGGLLGGYLAWRLLIRVVRKRYYAAQKVEGQCYTCAMKRITDPDTRI
jgi:hypothetical protein